MKLRLQYPRLACAAGLIVACALVSAAPVSAVTTYSGRAYAAFVNTPLTGPMYLSDTGELSPNGGFQSNALLTTSVPGVLSAEVLVASTSGASGQANSSASLANVRVLPGSDNELTAWFVRSEAKATCDGVQGSSQIANLTFRGTNIQVSGQPNQTIEIPGVAKLVINEQATPPPPPGTYREINVNALHLTVPGVAEVILSHAKSDINCVPPIPPGPCHDFVTGGGWITRPGNNRANFGFNAGFKDGTITPEVHLNYIDHTNGMQVKATSITLYVDPSPTSTRRRFAGSCEVNGVAGYTYSVEVADNGEPGQGSDTFSITLSNGYSASGTLAGGNIQLHKPCS